MQWPGAAVVEHVCVERQRDAVRRDLPDSEVGIKNEAAGGQTTARVVTLGELRRISAWQPAQEKHLPAAAIGGDPRAAAALIVTEHRPGGFVDRRFLERRIGDGP